MIAETMRRVLEDGGGNFSLEVLSQAADLQRRIHGILDATDRWQKRQRVLAAPLLVWLVLGMTLYRSVSINNVLLKILAAMRGFSDMRLKGTVSAEAVYKALARLSWQPLGLLAMELADNWAPRAKATFLGLVPAAIDGVAMTVPDTKWNLVGFGKPTASRGQTAFPQVNGAMLILTDLRIIWDAVWGACNMSELTVVEMLLDKLGPRYVLLLDRRYTKVDFWLTLLKRSIHFVHRVSSIYDIIPLRPLGPGDWVVCVRGHLLRVIEYRIGENEVVQLITDLMDPKRYPAMEIALGYHRRWEIELAYDEMKTHLSTVLNGTMDTTFRSKHPARVIQEAWGMVAAYNLLRGMMVDAGEKYNIPPLEISFVQTLEVVRNTMPLMQICPAAKRRLLYNRMLRDIADCRLDRSRRPRVVVRAVKRKMSKFHLKHFGDKSIHRDFAAEMFLVS